MHANCNDAMQKQRRRKSRAEQGTFSQWPHNSAKGAAPWSAFTFFPAGEAMLTQSSMKSLHHHHHHHHHDMNHDQATRLNKKY